MENFNLTDEEQKLFAEWFSNLDNDKQAKLSFKNVKQFLSSYQLKDDDLEKIMEICGAKRLGHFGRSQFYIALKLVSLAQNSYELNLENLNKPNLPLPKKINPTSSFNQSHQQFNTSFTNIHEASSNLNSLNSLNSNNSIKINLLPPPQSNRIKNQKLSPSFCKFCNKNLITSSDQYKNLKSFVLICPNCKNTNQSQDNLDLSPNNDLNSLSNEFNSNNTNNDYKLNNKTDQSSSSSDNSRCSSTELYETIDNSQAFEKLKQWEKLENQTRELGEIDEAKHCLLNDEDELEAQLNNKICLNVNQYTPNYFENDQLNDNQLNYNTEIDKIEEEETDEDVFMINDDQIKYYYDKFYQLLPNKQDILLAGCNVKSFFEKSKLSLNDLKHIWNLSDLDNDGSLTIVEFCIAMHLIVLKRNKVPLPDKLPLTLSNDKLSKLLLDNNLINKSYNHISKINISSNDSLNCNQQQPKNSFDNNYLNSSSASSNLSSSNSNLIIKNTFNLRNNQDNININDINSNLNTTSASNEIIYSPNHEWTKFNNSPFTTNQLNKNQQQINSQTNDVKLNLMTPANFIDRIELDPALIHPLPVKISNVNKDRNLFHKNSLNLVNHPPISYPPRPRTHGHARSSSLDLNRKFMNNNSTSSNNFHQGAFINYRKHIQQQQINRKQSMTDDGKPILDKQYYLNYLKTKYAIPQFELDNTSNLVNSLKERNFLMECIYEKIIDEFASTLEKLNN